MASINRPHKSISKKRSCMSGYTKKLEMAKAHRMIGEMCMLLSEFDNAKQHINTYLKIVKNLHNKVEEQRAYATLGRAELLYGQSLSETSSKGGMDQLKQAEKAFLKSLLLTKELSGQITKLEQLDMQARCYLNIGVVKEHMEDFEESITYIEKAIKISVSNDIFELTHLCYISMSLLYFYKKNDATLALRYCNLALDIAKRLPNKVKRICETLITKSEILIKEGDFASAKQILTKAYKKNTPDENDRNTIEKSLRVVVKICQILDELVTMSSLDYVNRKNLYEKLGDACCQLHNYVKALEYYNQMLKCAQLNSETGRSLIPIYVSLYQTYKDNKEYDKALEYLWLEFELNKNEPAEAFSTLCSIADICEMQNQSYWVIQDIYDKAKMFASKSDCIKLEKIAYARLKKLQLKHNMDFLVDDLRKEAESKGLDISNIEDESDSESEPAENNENTPEFGDDICLDDLTDSDMSDLDETEKPRPHRVTRGTRCLTIKRNNKGETQLHQACIAGNLELVRRLIDQGHIVNVRDHAGWIPLHEACNHGFRDIVELLLDRGATVAINDKGGTSCDGITPLYDACSNGFLDVVELLLERGADPTLKTDFGETCLNGLDKWRRSANLTEGEQCQYVQIRQTLLKPITKVGINWSENVTPLTNENVEVNSEGISDEENDLVVASTSMRRSNHNRSGGSGTILKSPNKSSSRQTSVSGAKEYKNVMAHLKHPNRVNNVNEDTFDTFPTSSLNVAKQKRSALLDAEDVDDDTWLIDDIGPEKKKRRFFNTNTVETRSPTKKSQECANVIVNLDTYDPEIDAYELLLSAGNAMSSQHKQKQKKGLSLSRSSSMSSSSSSISTTKQRKPKHQTSLIDNGFLRFRSDSPVSSEDSRDSNLMSTSNKRTTEPDSTTTSIHLLISPKSSPIKVQTAPILTTVSFKVKIEDELLLIPIERKKLNDVNIRWLADEAARRYYNLVGLKPVLRLKTADGFAYEETDSVTVAVEQNMILATVLEWKLSPLPQRYDEMCLQLNKEVNQDVQTVLERAQSSNLIELNDFWLNSQQTEPLFKAVMHQTNLQVLDLSNNFIQNQGCVQLAKSLPTLKQLKTLNLKCNFITVEGLESILSSADKLENFTELNLSQNPLGNSSLRLLDKFCNSVAGKTLQKLNLSQCNLTSLYDYDLCYYQLTEFNMSFNNLTDESIRILLTKLNPSRLQYLNLSYIKVIEKNDKNHPATVDRFVEFFESGTCEKFKHIAFAGCNLSDTQIYKIIQCLERANDLEVLDISDNSRVSALSLQFILEKLPQLRKLVAVNCDGMIDEQRLQSLSKLEHFPNFMSLTISSDCEESDYKQKLCSLWQNHWCDEAKNISFGDNLILYLNETDLIS
ncbi:tonsoku-like protein [Teleopsis dalmanni]|uniref:tonsoku-like protein n=1 Tax=Teleopsis dalmanni TaxID=139649 RepID=UPI0018CD274B|nr:tonsoku-like protein [Teleopsis dalmanni]